MKKQCFWFPKGFRKLLAALDCSWLLLAALGCSWLLLAAPGCLWLLWAALGCFRLLRAAACCSLEALGGSWGFWKLLKGFWKLLEGFWQHWKASGSSGRLQSFWKASGKLLEGFWKLLEGSPKLLEASDSTGFGELWKASKLLEAP